MDNEDSELSDKYSNTYINIELYNKAEVGSLKRFVRCETNITQASDILSNSSFYKMAIERFSIPSSVPLFIYPLDGDLLYRVELINNVSGASYTQNLEYKTPYRQVEDTRYGRGIYSYYEFLELVNIALDKATIGLEALDMTYNPQFSPYIRFNSITTLFELVISTNQVSSNWDIRMSYNLFTAYFPSFIVKTDASVHLPVKFVINNGLTKPDAIVGAFYITSETPCYAIWQQLQKILFTTNNIPVNAEVISSSDNRTRSVLLDFEPSPDIYTTTPFQYYANNYRWVDLISHNALNCIQLAVAVQYKNGDVFPLYLSPNEALTVKLIIRGKNSHLTN